MITLNDLSPKRRKDLLDTLQYQLHRPLGWGIAALQTRRLDIWEKWGFAALVRFADARVKATNYYNLHKEEIEEYLKGVEIC